MYKTGLVFSGGGGKGAYQIGVWKALREYGIEADCVAGTSVGALNGALGSSKKLIRQYFCFCDIMV